MILEPDTNRKFPRINFDQQVNFDFKTACCDDCQTKNLSLGGMFVTGNFQHHVGNNCNINLVSKEVSSGVSLQALAKVVRKTDEGIAIEFTSMPVDTYMFLQKTLLNVQTELLNEWEEPFENIKILAEDCPFEVAGHLPIFSEKVWDVIVPHPQIMTKEVS